MVLGKLPVPGRPTILITVGQGPIALAIGAGGVVWTFLLSSILSPLSPSVWETARYRLKYCLISNGNVNPSSSKINVGDDLLTSILSCWCSPDSESTLGSLLLVGCSGRVLFLKSICSQFTRFTPLIQCKMADYS